jgi:hypothetical protein
MAHIPIRLCSDAFGIEKEYVTSKAEAMERISALWDAAEQMMANYAQAGRDLSYRLCIDLGEYDEEGDETPKPGQKYMHLTQAQMYYRSFMRPRNFNSLSSEDRWAIDKALGILDWDGVMTPEQKERHDAHYDPITQDTIG